MPERLPHLQVKNCRSLEESLARFISPEILQDYRWESSPQKGGNGDEAKGLALLRFLRMFRLIRLLRLLKLEAEGFEPEILQGATQALKICEYLAIDGGFERGEACEETLSTQLRLLFAAGYELLGITPRPLRALLRNTAIANSADTATAAAAR